MRSDGEITLGSSGGLLQGDDVPEAFELSDEAVGFACRGRGGEVVAAGVGVDSAGGEHVPDGDDDRVPDGADRASVAASCP